MNTSYECDRELLVQADLDGELDAAQAAALLLHRAACVRCQMTHEQLLRARTLIRTVPRRQAPERLKARVSKQARSTDDSAGTESRSWRKRILTRIDRHSGLGWSSAAAAILVASIVLLAPRTNDAAAQVVNNHIRAMQLDSHLVDVASSEHHTVKPWFAGKLDFAPPVKELDNNAYRLKGGRVDIVNGRAVAVLVYQAGRHVIDVFVWPVDGGVGKLNQRHIDGFNLRELQSDDLEVWCISDMGEAELDRFAEVWRSAGP